MTAETPESSDAPGNEQPAESAPLPEPAIAEPVESALPSVPSSSPGNEPPAESVPPSEPAMAEAAESEPVPASSSSPAIAGAAESAPPSSPAIAEAPEPEASEPEPEPEPAPPPLPAHLAAIAEALGSEVEVTEQFGRVLATVPADRWVAAMTAARDELGADFLDWLTGVDELEAGYLVAAFVASTADRGAGRLGKAQGLILRTRVAKDAGQGAKLASVTGVYRGAAWHERETFEMFGIEFTGHEGLKPLLLPDGFEGHPLRKDFVLAARVAKAWPGAKEPGESDHHPAGASPGRRRMLPPGVPGEEWLKPYRAPESGGAGGLGTGAAAGNDAEAAE